MKKNDILARNAFLICWIAVCMIAVTGCKKFIEVPSPATSINAENVYTADETAVSVLTNIYASMSSDNNSIGNTNGSGLSGMTLYPGLAADEFTLADGLSTTHGAYLYYKNKLESGLTGTRDFWVSAYATIYTANAALEGISSSSTLTPAVRKQLLGEAHFVRAFCYFYLVNLYGDVPKVLSTNYSETFDLPRSPKAEIYDLITSELKEAQSLLSDNYLDPTLLKPSTERVRPNKFAATALLARVYLYKAEWKNAEDQAAMVIQNTAMYDTVSLNNVFLKNSKETIWSLQPVTAASLANTGDGRLFIPASASFPTSTNFVYLSSSLLGAFEANDNRYKNWVKSISSGGTTYYYPYKYKIGTLNASSPSEYLMVLRLAEQYLIRAEARAEQGNLSGALSDLNVIRKRAGLPGSTASGEPAVLSAIYHERQVEYFAEWGHRWLDLKRTDRINTVMPPVATLKGTTWNPNWALFPIPATDVLRDPNLVQNSGY